MLCAGACKRSSGCWLGWFDTIGVAHQLSLKVVRTRLVDFFRAHRLRAVRCWLVPRRAVQKGVVSDNLYFDVFPFGVCESGSRLADFVGS